MQVVILCALFLVLGYCIGVINRDTEFNDLRNELNNIKNHALIEYITVKSKYYVHQLDIDLIISKCKSLHDIELMKFHQRRILELHDNIKDGEDSEELQDKIQFHKDMLNAM